MECVECVECVGAHRYNQSSGEHFTALLEQVALQRMIDRSSSLSRVFTINKSCIVLLIHS